ncbi:MAG: SPOR domain-containing protein, partial [Chromatiales bacterium]|nr:SPOR domain-containing protein [Chromatiales bacterium]
MKCLIFKKLGKLLLLLFVCVSLDVQAQRRVIDHIETEIGANSNKVTVLFNVPVRYVSHLVNTRSNEIDVRLVPVITPGSEADFIGAEEVITWRATAEIPLERVIFRGELVGTSSLLLSFGSAIGPHTISQGGDQFSIVLELQKEKVVEEVQLETLDPDAPAPTPPEEIERVPATTIGRVEEKPLEIPEGNYVINLLSQAVPIDFSKIAPVPIGPDQRLYSTVATVKGRRWHRLRIGFFKSESEAKRVLRELRHFYRGAWIDLASPEEKRTFFLRVEEAPEEPIRLPKIDEAAPADERLASM